MDCVVYVFEKTRVSREFWPDPSAKMISLAGLIDRKCSRRVSRACRCSSILIQSGILPKSRWKDGMQFHWEEAMPGNPEDAPYQSDIDRCYCQAAMKGYYSPSL
jgi:hypothetical protein